MLKVESPNSIQFDHNYFKGYSIINGRNDNASNITGKNISLIASDAIGTATKKLIYEEDTLNVILLSLGTAFKLIP